MTVTISRLTPATADRYADFLSALEGEAAAAAFRAADHRLAQESFYLLLAAFATQPAGAAAAVLVPKLDARRGFLFVDELTVLPAFRRRGVARALLAYLEAEARALHLAGLRLLARPQNAAAHALYRAAGFAASESTFFEKRLG